MSKSQNVEEINKKASWSQKSNCELGVLSNPYF